MSVIGLMTSPGGAEIGLLVALRDVFPCEGRHQFAVVVKVFGKSEHGFVSSGRFRRQSRQGLLLSVDARVALRYPSGFECFPEMRACLCA